MKKKMVVLFLAAIMLLAVFSVYADATRNVSLSYNAGYTVLNYTYFFTGKLSKNANEAWIRATDRSTETDYVNPNTNSQTKGLHYTSLYTGAALICGERSVAFSGNAVFNEADMKSFSRSAANIRLRIRNGASDGRGYKTKGVFSATILDYN